MSLQGYRYYRYYSERLPLIAGKIQALKSMGLSLNLIKEI